MAAKKTQDIFVYISSNDGEPEDYNSIEDALECAEINGESVVYVYKLVGQYNLTKNWQKTA